VVNCADCVVAAVECPDAVGQALNVVDSDEVRVWRYVREYAKGTKQSGFFVPVPYLLGLGVARIASITSWVLFGKRGKLPSLLVPRRFETQFKPIRFSTRKLIETLKWRPPLSFRDCLASTFNSTRDEQPELGHAKNFEVALTRELQD
jgi:UDP-glucose 4-epimerase